MRDHNKLKVFGKADSLVRNEAFGLTAQMRRAAISVASNIVEGCARRSEAEFLRFIDTAAGSAKELAYQLSVAKRLGFAASSCVSATQLCDETVRMLSGLQDAIRSVSESSLL